MTSSEARSDESAPRAFSFVEVLKKRAEFLAAARARRHATPGFLLQARPTGGATIRVGFTCSKKVGNAVARNRAKRRLRAAAQAVLPDHGREGWDYVLVGRHRVTAERPWPALLSDLRGALKRVHEP